MAQVDVKWPSENEEFDAKSDQAVAVAEAPAETEEKKPEAAVEAPAAEEKTTESSKVMDFAPEKKPEPPVTSGGDAGATKPPAVVTSEKSHGSTGRLLMEVILALAVIGLGLWAWSLSSDKSNLQKQVKTLNNNPAIVQQRDLQDLLNKVGKLYKLPTDETPTTAVVSDAAAAKKSSSFFANAQNGDKVLLYAKNGLAILYRPSENKLVQVGPLTFTSGTTSSSTSSKSTTSTNTGSTSNTKKP